MIRRKIHWRVFVSCRRAKACNFSRLLTFCSETFPVECATQLWRSMRETTSCKKTQDSPGCFSLLIFFWPIRSRQFKHFRNWSCKSKCPGAHLDLTVNFHHEHSIVPTNCPWVSEGVRELESLVLLSRLLVRCVLTRNAQHLLHLVAFTMITMLK